MTVSTIFCQRCAALNSVNRSHCARCGTPLLILSSVRGAGGSFDEPDSLEEHLLERISALETEVQKLNRQHERLLDLIHRQATTSFHDHALLDAVVSVLEERGGVQPGEIESRWRDLVEQYTDELDAREHLEDRVRAFLDAYKGPDITSFERLVDEGLDMLLNGSPRRGIRRLEKALLLDPDNVPLGLFLGEHYFFGGKRTLARHYLEQVSLAQPRSSMAALLLGVLCGDDGETDSAREHFERALAVNRFSFAAHYGLGRLHALEGRYGEALAHFKRALTAHPSPEMHYLVGRAYVAEGKSELAIRHMKKAVGMDPEFDAALYQLGLLYLERSDVAQARRCFEAALDVNPGERRYKAAVAASDASGLTPLPVFGAGRITRKNSITSGDARFTIMLMQTLASDAINGTADTAE